MPMGHAEQFHPPDSAQNIIPEKKKFESPLEDLETAEEYLTWKQEVPAVFRSIVESVMKNIVPAETVTGLRLADQFLKGCAESLAMGSLADMSSYDARVTKLLAPLAHIESKDGYVNIFSLLANTQSSWKLKKTLYETQLRTAFEWLINKDLEQLAQDSLKQAEHEQITNPDHSSPEQTLPPQNEEVRSSMEAGSEKSEGEPTPIFSIAPYFGGYYKQLVFSKFQAENQHWAKEENKFENPLQPELDLTRARVESGLIHGRAPLALPVPYDWAPDPDSVLIKAPNNDFTISRNQNGSWYLVVEADGVFPFSMTIAPLKHTEVDKPFEILSMTGELPDELRQAIETLKQQRLPQMKLQREVVKLVRNSLKYSNSPEAWKQYTSQSQGFFNSLWERKEADCFVANTLALLALTEIEAQARFVSGYYVKEAGQSGNANLHASCGHAWLEVWDEYSERAVRLDATPKGDPTINEEQQEQDLAGETGEGDYGEHDDEIVSEEELKKNIAELKRKQASEGEQTRPKVDLAEQRFADLAECRPEQAREFLQALERVRKIADKQGHPISDRLKDEWRKIVEERKIESHDYRGPVRMDEGSRLEDPVLAAIDIKSSEFNPTGFEKDTRVEKIELDFGGINVYFSFDLSGSMAEADLASGRSKKDVQRDVALLFVDSLMQAAVISRREGGETNLLPIKIMATVASQTGETKLPLTDTWGPKEQWALYSSLTQVARGGTPTHTTLQLIERSLVKELADLKQKGTAFEKMPLHYTAEISDGGSDDATETENMHYSLKAKAMVIRSYTIGGSSASADAAPPLESFSQLPEILAEDIIKQFRRLHPRKVKI